MAKRSKSYFKHELDAYRHPKLISLRLSGHAAAEPFYWAALSYIYDNHCPLPCETSSLDFIAFCHDMCCDFATATEAIGHLVEAQLLYRCEGGVSSERAEETVEQWEETSAKRSAAGSKGGRPSAESKGAAKESNAKASEKQNGQKEKQSARNEKQKKEEEGRSKKREEEGDGAREHAPKRPHGEYGNVRLSDEELAKLKAQFPDLSQRIERLDGYIEQTGKRYKSHYATIRNWARKDADEAKGRASPARGATIYEVSDGGEGWIPE